MDSAWKTALMRQFLASIDMLENALRTCPDDLWDVQLWNDPDSPQGFSEFWYVAYHSLFWLDLYLSGSVEGFTPPPPFTLDELDPAGLLPERQYHKDELLSYLAHCRGKCQTVMVNLTDDLAQRRCKFTWGELSFVELLLDNMRHVQEHAAQLNLVLGQKAGQTSRWISKASI